MTVRRAYRIACRLCWRVVNVEYTDEEVRAVTRLERCVCGSTRVLEPDEVSATDRSSKLATGLESGIGGLGVGRSR